MHTFVFYCNLFILYVIYLFTICTEFGNLRVKVDLDAALGSIEVILDYDGRVKAVEVTSESKSVDDSIILADTRSFVPPQDLRFALFAAVASLRSLGHIRDDVSELRKRCLVKMVEPYVACITTANGLVATVALHYCYPSVC